MKDKFLKSNRNILPINYKIPERLKTLLCSVNCEIMDHRNRNDIKCIVPQNELPALKELIRLHKDKLIVIFKGAGMIILCFVL